MKKAIAAGLVIAGIMTVTGSALADTKKPETKLVKPPLSRDIREDFGRKKPPMSRDKRPPLPPDGKHPRLSDDKRPPMPPRSGDKRPPEFDRKQPKK